MSEGEGTETDPEYGAGDVNTTVAGPAEPADAIGVEEEGSDREAFGEGVDLGSDEVDDLDDADELDDAEDDEIEEADGLDDMAGNRTEGGTPSAVLTYLARSLASDPDAVIVEVDRLRDTTRLRLFVAPEDMGRVIGRRGRTAQAIRTLIGAAGARDGIRTSVDIVDD